ncbi:nucleotidyltransferase domain-containing protein [Streptomyces sp. WAC07061]|uniref:nucleotidyltransferase domain-containing protein n=1 Tax=Streptomyces sp. WAC07061 TaxID=2487410 RepID=UPI000F793C62|nr:nucleotidyltransferase domain-containing protein [Streptomyces sp. WAC07061]RSS38668.1 nucleotidyltransferase domain-containing protein [Streptomyces sp. WAC07061]
MSSDADAPSHPANQARRLAAEWFPNALSVVLAGSAASGRATPTSDLDIVVLIEDGGETRRETLRFDHRRAWTGSGRWLPRRLLQADPEHGGALLDGYRRLCETGHPERFADAAGKILALVGGPLREGYTRTWRAAAEPGPR